MSSNSLTEDLRVYVSVLAGEVDDAVETPVPQESSGSSKHRRLLLAAAVAAVVAATASVIGLAVGNDEGGVATEGGADVAPVPGDPEPSDDLPEDPQPGGTRVNGPVGVLPDMPLEVRGDVAVAWTGDELMVWGGDVEAANMGLPGEDRQYADGAVFDPATDTWRPMSAGPLPTNIETPVAVRTIDGVVIARGTSVASWDPSQDAWQTLPSAPETIRDLTWTGDSIVSASANAVLDFDSDAWRSMEAPPAVLDRPTTAWTGSELVVVGGPSTPFTPAAAIALDPQSGTWRSLPDPPEDLHAEALSAAWDGERVLVVNYDMQAVSYDPSTETWARVAPVPARFSEFSPVLESAQGHSVAFMAQAVAVLRPDGRWLPLPYGNLRFGTTVIADDVPGTSGPVVYSVGVDAARDRNVVSALHLGEATDAPNAVQVGVATVEMPDGFDFVSADFEQPAGPTSEVVSVDLEHDGGTCQLTSTYGAVVNEDGVPMLIEETLPQSPDTTWRRNQRGTAWITDRSTSDTLRITCDTPQDARLLAESVQP